MFTDSYLPAIDGVVNSLIITRRELEKLGHDVFVFAPEPVSGKIPEPYASDPNLRLFRAVEFRWYPGYRVAVFPSNKNSLIEELDIDLIHSHGIAFMGLKSMLASHELKLPLVLTYHTMVSDALKHYLPPVIPEEILVKLSWIYLNQFLKRCEGLIAPTNVILEEIKGMCPNMQLARVIPTGIELARFQNGINAQAIREKHGIVDNEVIVHVGRLGYEKNLEVIISALKVLKKTRPKAKLLVVGKGPAEEQYKRFAKEQGMLDDIIFTGFVSDKLLPSYYASGDIFAIASEFETQGLVVIEAMATGRPVAGVNFRAIPEIIEDGKNGFLFEPKDIKGCAEAMNKAFDAGEDIRKNAVARAGQFTTVACVKKLEGFYSEVLARGAKTGLLTKDRYDDVG